MSALLPSRDAVANAMAMRITMFRPVDVWHDLDRHLRDMTALFAAQEGLLDAWVGRSDQGTGEEWVVVSAWSSHAAQASAPTLPGVGRVPDLDGSVIDVRTEVFDVRIRERFVRHVPMRLLRVYRGTALPGELQDYLHEARLGVAHDGAHPHGPGAFVCGTDGDDRFATASLWDGWDSIERATGGDIHHPLATRHVARLAVGAPTHFELIATTADHAEPPPDAPPAPGGASSS